MRNEAAALGGYYATIDEVIPAMCALVARGSGDHYSVLDPCAADGSALVAVARGVFGQVWNRVHLYGVELEQTRAAKLLALSKGKSPAVEPQHLHALSGDSFAVEWQHDLPSSQQAHGGPSLAFINAPYHNGNLEHRFLERWTGAIRPGGVLMWHVPYYSLNKVADLFGRHYNVIACYRLPEPWFSQDPTRAFKQVILYAARRDSLLDPDPRVVRRVLSWAADAASIPVLPEAGTAKPIVTAHGHAYHRSGFASWRVCPSDIEGIGERFQPFMRTTKTGAIAAVPGMVPPSMAELLCRSYPVATPLKPAHIATAIAAGVFNGALITPDDDQAGWPNLLVKGVFDREFVEVDEKTNKDGEKTASIRVQQPRLRVTVLDLRAGRYHTLVDSDEESDASTVDRLTTADLLAVYGRSLLRVMLDNCPALHDPARDGADVAIAPLARPLYEAQAHTVRAVLKLLGAHKPIVVAARARYKRRKTVAPGIMAEAVRRHYRGKNAILLGQPGCGKSGMALATMKTMADPIIARGGQWRTLVMCPPHLLAEWRDQAAAVVPDARVVYLDGVEDVDALAQDTRPGLTVAVMAQTSAKLGHAWDGITHTRTLLAGESREGVGCGSVRRARKVMHVRLTVWSADAAEVWAGIESSQDGHAWSLVSAFDEMTAHGEQYTRIECGDAKWVRVVWSASAPASFAVTDEQPTEAACPRCGVETPAPDKASADHRDNLAAKRLRCPRKHRVPVGRMATASVLLAETIYNAFPHAAEVGSLLGSRASRRALAVAAERVADLAAPDGIAYHHSPADQAQHNARVAVAHARAERARHDPRLRTVARMVAKAMGRTHSRDVRRYIGDALSALLWAIGDDALTANLAVAVYRASEKISTDTWGEGAEIRSYARALLHMIPPNAAEQDRARDAMMATGMRDESTGYYAGYVPPWRAWEQERSLFANRECRLTNNGMRREDGTTLWNDKRRGDPTLLVMALAKMSAVSTWDNDGDKAVSCGEPLYSAVADPTRGGRRVPLSRYIVRRHRKLFDMLVLDEMHEAANADSAISRSAWRLAGIGMPVLAMTGTAMGGYAEQLWAAQLALDPKFREEFARTQKGDFIDRYGYVKIQERDVDKTTGEVKAYGSASDRVTRETKILGNAPGVLPLFLLRYLLRVAPVLHKADLALELPPCREIPVTIDPGPVLGPVAHRMLEELKAQIKRDRFDRFLAGKLFGALAHFATDYPLLASEEAGNAKGGYEIRYPRNPELGASAGALVTSAPGLPRDMLLPIEQWAVDLCRAELSEGRRCMVMATSSSYLPRMRRLLEEHLGEPVVFLDAKKVPTDKRKQWIVDNIVTPGIRVCVVNPEAIQTGLNPLVHFSTELWLQNPGCRAITYRQACARVDRIGAKLETRIYTATYALPAAQAAYTLWMHKVGVSLATDGLDAGGALAAAGVGGENGERIDGFSVGKLIHEVMTGSRQFRSRKHATAAEPIQYRATDAQTIASTASGKTRAARGRRAKVTAEETPT